MRVSIILRRILSFYIHSEIGQSIELRPENEKYYCVALCKAKFLTHKIGARVKFVSKILKILPRNRKFRVNEE